MDLERPIEDTRHIPSPRGSPDVTMITPMKVSKSPAFRASGSSSITPKANNANRYREALSATPTPAPIQEIPDDNDEWPAEDDWGDEAVLEWRAEEDSSTMSGMDDDASSVAREDAGLPDNEDEDEDDDWGQDALMTWDDLGIEGDSDDAQSSSDDNGALGEPEFKTETEEDLIARGMPTYRDWPIKKLQVSRVESGLQRIGSETLVALVRQVWLPHDQQA